VLSKIRTDHAARVAARRAQRYSELVYGQREQLTALAGKLGWQFHDAMRSALAQLGVPGPESHWRKLEVMVEVARRVRH
jgi:hypothetical protein